MNGKLTYLFATRNDLMPGLKAVEEQRPLQYVLSGLFPTPEVEPLSSALAIPDFGSSRHGDARERYLVLDAGQPIQVRAVRQRRGGVRYAVDTDANPTGIFFTPGGVHGDQYLIRSEIMSVGDPRSLKLYDTFTRDVLRGFARMHSFRVGPEAERLLDGGWHLTRAVGVSAEFDLKRLESRRRSVRPLDSRLPLVATWEYLKAEGYEVPEDQQGQPFLPNRMPSHDDEEPLGLSFFRTGLQEEDLARLTIPRTFFGRSEFEGVSFHNTDLSASRMCWNDFAGCDFSNAVLCGADLRASAFVRCQFRGADLTEADLRWSSFEECDFTGARMRRAKLAVTQRDALALADRQMAAIDWQPGDGPEPPGG